jgi:P27 family predicted phage terminase small subunit
MATNDFRRRFSMGRRGPAPQPATVRLLNGRSEGRDSGGRKVRTPGRGFIEAAPEKPEDLSARASQIWDVAVADLERVGSLKLSDGPGLEMLCEAGAAWYGCRDRVRKTGRYVKRPSGVVALSPLVADMRAAEADYRSWVREFGLTYSVTAQLVVGDDDYDDRHNPFAG